jgi:hypothetical protein
MTGWRLGWLVLPSATPDRQLVEFNTSCAPVFIQRAGLWWRWNAPMTSRRAWWPISNLPRHPGAPAASGARVQVTSLQAGMYAFSGWTTRASRSSLDVAKRLVLEAGLGLAPGNAFMVNPGPDAQGWLRWCFASQDTAPGDGAWSFRHWRAIIQDVGAGCQRLFDDRRAAHDESGHFYPMSGPLLHRLSHLAVQEETHDCKINQS